MIWSIGSRRGAVPAPDHVAIIFQQAEHWRILFLQPGLFQPILTRKRIQIILNFLHLADSILGAFVDRLCFGIAPVSTSPH